jgi:hypothetical protein
LERNESAESKVDRRGVVESALLSCESEVAARESEAVQDRQARNGSDSLGKGCQRGGA